VAPLCEASGMLFIPTLFGLQSSSTYNSFRGAFKLMKVTDPTAVYSGLDFEAAKRLAEYLRNAGVDARIAVPDPECAVMVPMFQTHHEVLAMNFDEEHVRELIDRWTAAEDAEDESPTAEVGLYCYHCGEPLAAPVPVCPHCHRALD
jgi:hypothetical protein